MILKFTSGMFAYYPDNQRLFTKIFYQNGFTWLILFIGGSMLWYIS